MPTSARRSRFATEWASARSSNTAADREHTKQVMPAASGARLDDIGGQRIGASVELCQLRCGRHAPPVRRQSRPEHICDEEELFFATDRAGHRCGSTDVARRPNQFGMGIAHLVLPEPATMELVDQVAPRQTMVNDCARPAQSVDPKSHSRKASELRIRQRRNVTGHTVVL